MYVILYPDMSPCHMLSIPTRTRATKRYDLSPELISVPLAFRASEAKDRSLNRQQTGKQLGGIPGWLMPQSYNHLILSQKGMQVNNGKVGKGVMYLSGSVRESCLARGRKEAQIRDDGHTMATLPI